MQTPPVSTSSQGIAIEILVEMTVFSRPKGSWQPLMPEALPHPLPAMAEATTVQQSCTTVSSLIGRPGSSLIPPLLAVSSGHVSSSPGQCHPLHNESDIPPCTPNVVPGLL